MTEEEVLEIIEKTAESLPGADDDVRGKERS